jgi:hypothetical protein
VDERLVQALIRLVIVFITAGLAALGTSLTVLQEAISDPILASTIVAVVTAVINAILKYLGGATSQPVTEEGVRASNRRGENRPNVLAV